MHRGQDVGVLGQVAMGLTHPERLDSLEQTQRVGHATVAVGGDLVGESAGSLDLQRHRSVLIVAGDIEQAVGIDDRMDRLLECAAARDQLRRHGQRAPARGVEKARVVVAEVDPRRGQVLVESMEAVEDAEQGRAVVALVEPAEGLDDLFFAGERKDDRERPAVGRAQHHQPAAASLAGGVLHGAPHVGMELDEAARHQPPHRMGEQVDGLTPGPALDERGERGGALVDVEPPVERERPRLPAGLQLEQQVRIGRKEAGGAHGVRRRERRAVEREPQLVETAREDPEQVEPHAIALAARIHRVELGAHDAGKHDHPAEGRAASPAARRLVEARQAFVAELGGQDLALRGSESEERGPRSLDVARGQRSVERGEARTISIARHAGGYCPPARAVNRGCVLPLEEYSFPWRSVSPLRP
ncbi:MAG TPA: hypothetical protein VNH43_08030 [Vicinamibacteria bacterium]|nr:hypothetical protein [Vicinamibacteria bacterium]